MLKLFLSTDPLLWSFISRIIEPIVSRCSKFRFKPLSSSDTLSKLSEICKSENIKVTEPVLASLIKVSDGDLRRSITFLQSASKLRGVGSKDDPTLAEQEEISLEDVEEIGGVIPDSKIRELMKTLGIDVPTDGDVEMADGNSHSKMRQTQFEKVNQAVELIMRQGYSSVQLISQVTWPSKCLVIDETISLTLTFFLRPSPVARHDLAEYVHSGSIQDDDCYGYWWSRQAA